MNILITAGNTQTPIDRVRCITNIFTGRTGAAIALEAHRRGHGITLLTSHPETVAGENIEPGPSWRVLKYRTFDELDHCMATTIRAGALHAVIHAAAINDYQAAGIYAPAAGTRFDPEAHTWTSADGPPTLVDRAAGKVKSDEPELWLRLTRAPKLVDKIRTDWNFRGILVKFKLEVGKTDAELLDIAERSRLQSQADFMVANTLEDAAHWAYLGPVEGRYDKVSRRDLAERLVQTIAE